MAEVVAKVSGGNWSDYDCETVKELRKKLGLDDAYKATVNKNPEDDSYELEDGQTVIFAPAMKGGVVRAA